MRNIRPHTMLIASIAMMCSSCATIINGSYQRVNVYSSPPGAKVFVNGVDKNVTTPGHVTLKRSNGDHRLRFERPGFEDESYTLTPRFNPLVIIDFLYIFPGIIDLAVGANHQYEKNVGVEMKPVKAPALIPATTAAAPTNRGYNFNRMSDVDMSIPESAKQNPNRYALIIGNEDYSTFQKDLTTEADVAYARNDASAFYEYAQKVLGVPERNITLSLDATSAEMRQGLMKMNLIAKNTGGQAEFFVFYAGHGLPDEETKQPYLIPVDVSGKFIKVGIPLTEFYSALTEFPTKRTTVFLDACFSGGARNQGLYASRGVRVTPKNEMLKGNVVVFSASSGEESALPHVKKYHGLFTYYLLQKLKESRGDLTYKDLSLFMEQQVALESVIINSKEQHPKTNISADVVDIWEVWTLR
ncbi:MAG TPA: caspase family protein [Cyclobacteriaceae bacterium]|nr:caspase family protein [Cyclobacteriaceae bacterium]